MSGRELRGKSLWLGKKSKANSTERCTALCLEINTDKASGRKDTEDDEHGGKASKVGSLEASRHSRNLDCTQDRWRLEKVGRGSLYQYLVPSLEDPGIFEITPTRPPSLKECQEGPTCEGCIDLNSWWMQCLLLPDISQVQCLLLNFLLKILCWSIVDLGDGEGQENLACFSPWSRRVWRDWVNNNSWFTMLY